MHLRAIFSLLGILLTTDICLAAANPRPECVPFTEAEKHAGPNQCIRGTVAHVEEGRNGTRLLNFCPDKVCPFVVVVFPADLKKLGDIRQLEGRQIEIKGTVQNYDGHAEIILRHSQQLGESAYRLFPPVPTEYDVERTQRNSAGKYKRAKSAKKTTAAENKPVPIEDPGEPQ